MPPTTKVKLSREELVRECTKCKQNPSYFIKNYIKISHPTKGILSFNLYPFQEQCLEDFQDHRFNIVLKARQLGLSTLTSAYILWVMLFHRGKEILIVANKHESSKNMLRRVKQMFKKLPSWLQIAKIHIDNVMSLELDNMSKVKAVSSNEDAARSEALSLLVIDEAAMIQNIEGLWTAAYPTLTTGGNCIVLSTPKGVGNWYHKTYIGALVQDNNFHPTELMWWVHPEHDDAWFKNETKNMSQAQIAQEYLCSFNASGETVIHPDDILRLGKEAKEPKYKTGFDRNFWIWEEFQDGNEYLLSSDSARGDGADSSVFVIIKINTMEVVAEYKGKVTPDIFATLLFNAGMEYGGCMIVVETNATGIMVLDKLIEAGYKKIFYSAKSTHEYVEQIQAENDSNTLPGFSTTSKTRPMIIAKLEEFIRNRILKTYSIRFVKELESFIWHNGRPEAMRGYHDDLVMACAIGCWVKEIAFEVNLREIEYKKSFLSNIKMTQKVLDTKIHGMLGYRSPQDPLSKPREFQEVFRIYKG